jgi:chromosomal replication initiator protein
MAAGLVCSIQPLDSTTREQLLRRWLSERCQLAVEPSLIESINPMLAGDGRVISGIVNVINTLQRMFGRTPTLDELRQFAGQLLRGSRPVTTLSVIEQAVCEAFQLPVDSLRGKSQTRAITGPRMLAMYLSRQMTSAAYAEIARHFGGRSHSTAISAEQNVKSWLNDGGEVGRGRGSMSAREAIDRVETLLRSG